MLSTVGDTAYVAGGLEDNMRISMAAVNSLRNGTKVRIASTKTRDPSSTEAAYLELSSDPVADKPVATKSLRPSRK